MKRALLPLMPDGLMARYRYHREQLRALLGIRRDHSLSRSNVDLIVDADDARRWLLSTPDTFRVVDRDISPAPTDTQTIAFPAGAQISDLVGFVGWDGVTAVVTGKVDEPKWGSKTSGSRIQPTGLAIDRAALSDLAESFTAETSLPRLLSRILDAGYKIALAPEISAHVDSARRDRIERGVVVVLAAVPLHDVGGGSRGAQLALEFIRRGFQVMYVNRYPSYEATELGLRFIHPNLEQMPLHVFSPQDLVDRCSDEGIVVLEIPDPAYESALSTFASHGWTTIFDIIDEWSDQALGGEWYDEVFEDAVIRNADIVIASAADLVDRAARVGRSDTVLVPNGVNATIFDGSSHGRPRDLPAGSIIGYHGSLYGDWIDWAGINAVANANPGASVVLIGENRNTPTDLPANVVFLGLKPQSDLPAYLQHFDVGFVPFVVSATTHAVSPLKVYEYLASGVPVAAPPLRSLSGLNYVYTAAPIERAVQDALTGSQPDPAEALTEHGWDARLGSVFAALRRDLPAVSSQPVRIEQRPFVRYRWVERRVKQRS